MIRRLKDQGYLNDSKYAAYFSSLRRDNQKFGRLRVITELKIKGVHGEVIDKAVDAAYERSTKKSRRANICGASAWSNQRIRKQAARIFRNWSAPDSARRRFSPS